MALLILSRRHSGPSTTPYRRFHYLFLRHHRPIRCNTDQARYILLSPYDRVHSNIHLLSAEVSWKTVEKLKKHPSVNPLTKNQHLNPDILDNLAKYRRGTHSTTKKIVGLFGSELLRNLDQLVRTSTYLNGYISIIIVHAVSRASDPG